MAAELDKLAEDLRHSHPEFANSIIALAQLGRSIGVPEFIEHSSEVSPEALLSDPREIQRRLVLSLQESVDLLKPDLLNERMGEVMWQKVGRYLHPEVRLYDTLRLPAAKTAVFDELGLSLEGFSVWTPENDRFRKSFTGAINSTSREYRTVGSVQEASFVDIECLRGLGKVRSKFVAAFFQGPAKRVSIIY